MEFLLHETFFLFLGFLIGTFHRISTMHIVSLLCAIAFVTLTYAYSINKITILCTISFFFVSTQSILFLTYLPAICYPFMSKKTPPWYLLIVFIPILIGYNAHSFVYYLYTCILMLFSYKLKLYYDEHTYVQSKSIKQYDASRKLSLILTEKNQNLCFQQHQEIRIATLKERNRIAREIHDNVGHLLSSSLLQIGAIQAITSDERIRVPLQNLHDTVYEGMNNVRCGVHDLYEQSIVLEEAIQKIIAQYSFVNIQFEYTIQHSLSQTTSYHFIAILKECFTNTIKHSNATQVWITLCEHPTFYQFIIKDNGTKKATKNEHGIGLESIRGRVADIHGNLHIDTREGFHVFISVPKEVSTL